MEVHGLVRKAKDWFIKTICPLFFYGIPGPCRKLGKDIIRDPSGNLWVGTNDGISKANVTRDSLGLSIDFKNFDAKVDCPDPIPMTCMPTNSEEYGPLSDSGVGLY